MLNLESCRHERRDNDFSFMKCVKSKDCYSVMKYL